MSFSKDQYKLFPSLRVLFQSYSSSVWPRFGFTSVTLPFMHTHLSKQAMQTAPALKPLSSSPAIPHRAVEQLSLHTLGFHPKADDQPCGRARWSAWPRSLQSPAGSTAPSPAETWHALVRLYSVTKLDSAIQTPAISFPFQCVSLPTFWVKMCIFLWPSLGVYASLCFLCTHGKANKLCKQTEPILTMD